MNLHLYHCIPISHASSHIYTCTTVCRSVDQSCQLTYIYLYYVGQLISHASSHIYLYYVGQWISHARSDQLTYIYLYYVGQLISYASSHIYLYYVGQLISYEHWSKVAFFTTGLKISLKTYF